MSADSSAGVWAIRLACYDGGQYLGYVQADSGGPGSLNNSWQRLGSRVKTPLGTVSGRILLLNEYNDGFRIGIAGSNNRIRLFGSPPFLCYYPPALTPL